MNKIAQGSNKDIYSIEDAPEHLLFKMTSRVSVFDVGALEDDIPKRAASMERFAQAVAKYLDQQGIDQAWDAKLSQTHSGFVQRRVRHSRIPSSSASAMAAFGTSTMGQALMGAATEMIASAEDAVPVFVPLEVIVRWGVPVGSSLVKKDPQKYKVGTRFEEPQVDYTTKLESQDRPLSFDEAQSLCPEGLELSTIETFVKKVGKHLQEFFSEKGLDLWDAKFEMAWDRLQSKLILVDAITPDELRLTLKGLDKVPLSKELLRFWLRQTPWYDEVEKAKKSASENWRDDLSAPPRLGAWRTQFLSKIYESLADIAESKSSTTLMNLIRGAYGVDDKSLPKPKVCVVGSGGREEALRWRLQQEGCEIVFKPEEADATYISSDQDLAEGMADQLREQGLWAFGPSQKASQLEWSKSFGRDVAQKAGVPTPKYSRNRDDFKDSTTLPVIKLDGLAAGKGVYLPESQEAFEELVKELTQTHSDYIFEERCAGEEASAFFLIERDAWGFEKARFLGSAKDFKRRYLGDEGPNTGGMGAYAPHPSLKPEDIEVFRKWALQTAHVMTQNGVPYRGVLYMGLMKDKKKGWVLIEYNARMGDPETQALAVLWPQHQNVVRSFLQLSPWTDVPDCLQDSETQSMCLSLVHPEYPKSCEALDLPQWEVSENCDVQLFKTQSRTGRLAYLVAQGSSVWQAGDKIFEELLESPWKNFVEWRSDILR